MNSQEDTIIAAVTTALPEPYLTVGSTVILLKDTEMAMVRHTNASRPDASLAATEPLSPTNFL